MQVRLNCNQKKTQKKAHVYSYARWSSDGQTDGDSLRRQTQLAQNWCAARGLTVTDSARDEGISAWNGKNRGDGTGLSRLLKLVRPGDFLLVEDNDRLSRQDWLTHMNFLRDITVKGVTVVTLSNGNEIDAERFKNDPGCFLPAVLSAHLGHSENEKKSQRIKESWQARYAKLAKGQPANLRLPCWLAWDKEADKPVLVEYNATVIRKMFSLALTGLGCQTIARRLHKEEAKLIVKGKRRERRLTLSAPYVWRTLRSKLAIGYGVYVQPPQPGVYPAVVDEQTFYAVQQRLDTNKHQTARRATSTPSLFTGIAFCSKCGGTLCRFTQCRNGKSYQYLVCSDTLHKHGQCGMTGMRYDALETTFLHLLSQTDLVRQAMSEKPLAVPTRLDSLSGQLADSKRQITKLMTLIKDDPNPSKAVYGAIKNEEAKAAGLRQQIEIEHDKLRTETPPLEGYAEFCERFAERMGRPEFRLEVRSLLRNFVSRIEVRLGENSYRVWFKDAKQAIAVDINRAGWTFSPDPLWVAGRPVPQGSNVMG